MSIKETLERFRDKLYNKLYGDDALFDRSGNNVSRQVKNLFQEKIETALNGVVPEDADNLDMEHSSLWEQGWDSCLTRIKKNINNYLNK